MELLAAYIESQVAKSPWRSRRQILFSELVLPLLRYP